MTASGRISVVLDPLSEVVSTLRDVEDRLLFADLDDPTAGRTVMDGAEAAGLLTVDLQRAARRAPSLWLPGRAGELAPLLAVEELLARVIVVAGGVTAVAFERPEARRAATVLERLVACARQSSTDDGRTLPDLATADSPVIELDPAQTDAYRRFAAAVLVDPLDRFAAIPPPATSPGIAPRSPVPGI